MSKTNFAKRILSLFLSLIMIIISIPFTTLTASAATENLSSDRHGILVIGDSTRWSNNQYNIVNDQQPKNTSAAVLHYDLSKYKNTKITDATFSVYIDQTSDDTEVDYVNYYYSTSIYNDSGYLTAGGKQTPNLGISGSGAGTSGRDALLNHLQVSSSNLLARTARTANTGSFKVADTIKSLVDAGHKDLYITIVLNKAGGSGSTSGWSDVKINPASVNFSISYENYDFNSTAGNKEYIDNFINSWNMPNNTVKYIRDGNTTAISDINSSKVLYTSNAYTDGTAQNFCLNGRSDNTGMNAKAIAAVNRIVYMYTGDKDKSEIKVPVMIQTNVTGDILKSYKLNYISSNDSNWAINGNWYDSDLSTFTAKNTSGTDGKNVVSSSNAHNTTDYISSTSSTMVNATDINGTYHFINTTSYNGNTNFSNNYLKLSNPAFDISIDGWSYYTTGSLGWKKHYQDAWNNIKEGSANLAIEFPTSFDLPTDCSYSMVDFSVMQNMYSRVKSEYASAKANEAQYTNTSILKYYQAVQKMVSIDPKNYDLSTDSGVQTFASDMKTAIDNYNKAELVCAHKNIGTKNGKLATCTEEGYTGDAYCTFCDETLEIGSSIPAKGHTAGTPVKENETAPTCTTNGSYDNVTKCTVCDVVLSRDTVTVNATGHNYSGAVTQLYESGLEKTTSEYKHSVACVNDGSHTQEVQCNFVDYPEGDIAATKDTEGKDFEKCSVCGGTRYTVIPKLSATKYNITFVINADEYGATEKTVVLEVEEGKMPTPPDLPTTKYDNSNEYSYKWDKEIVAATGEATYTAVVVTTPHNYVDTVIPPTCETDGYTLHTCQNAGCGYSYTSDTTTKLGHNYSDWVSDGNGQHTKTCVNDSSHKITVACSNYIKNTEQSVEPTCTESGKYVYTCEDCGYVLEQPVSAKGHTLGAMQEIQRIEPSCTESGLSVKAQICSVCGAEENRTETVLDATGHNFQTKGYEATCTENAYMQNKCINNCGLDDGKKYPLVPFEYKDVIPGEYPVNNYSGSSSHDSQLIFDLAGLSYTKIEIAYTYTISNKKGEFKIYNDSGVQLSKVVGTATNQTGTITVTGTSSVTFNLYNPGSNGNVTLNNVTVYLEAPEGFDNSKLYATDHSFNYDNDNNSADGVLGTHFKHCDNTNTTGFSCSEDTHENHDIQITNDGNNIVASCRLCDYQQTLYSRDNKHRITTGNIFSFDGFINSGSNVQPTKGVSSWDTTDDAFVIVGTGDNYTNHSYYDNMYTMDVTPYTDYAMSYDSVTGYARVLVFGYNEDRNTITVLLDKHGSANGDVFNTRSYSKIYIRYGTNENRNEVVYDVISNLAIYKNDGSYSILVDDVTNGTKFSEAVASVNGNDYLADFCGWGVDGNTTVTSNMNVTPTAHVWKNDAQVDPNCTNAGTEAGKTCTVCGATEGYTVIPALGHDYVRTMIVENGFYTWKDTCSRCGDVSLNQSVDANAYNAAVAEANASIANKAKYTVDSRNDLETVVTNNTITFEKDNPIEQTAVETATTAIQTAISELALNQYTVELYYVINDGTPQKQEDQTYTKDYGTLVVLNAPKDGYFVEKWVRAELLEDGTDGKEYPVNSTSNNVSYTTNSNSKYYVYLKSTTASTDKTQSTIFLKGRNGKTLSSAYVVTGTEYEVKVSGSKITVNGQSMTAPVIPFYNFDHFEMNGATLESGNMTFNENVEIQAVYEAAHTQYTITLEGDCTGQTTAYYDEKVVITATNGNENTVWYILNNGSYQVCGYGPTYTFRASRDITIKCENKEVVAQPSVTVTRLTYGGIREKTISAEGSFYLPEGYTLVKTGVLMKTSVVNDRTAVDNYDNYIGVGTAPAKEFIAENYVKDTKQFTINVYSAKDRTQIYIGAVGFLTYKDKGNIEHTVYSDLVIEDWHA